jgi:hypothetical protein
MSPHDRAIAAREALAENVSAFITAIADGLTNGEVTHAIMVNVDEYVSEVRAELIEAKKQASHPPAQATTTDAGWRPIATAPKDGTKILVWTYHDAIEMSEWYTLSHDEYTLRADGLYEKRVVESEGGWNSNTPLFWTPLPAPPALASVAAALTEQNGEKGGG